jgi:hypothetical protein
MHKTKDGESKFDRVIISIEKTVHITNSLLETLEKVEKS